MSLINIDYYTIYLNYNGYLKVTSYRYTAKNWLIVFGCVDVTLM